MTTSEKQNLKLMTRGEHSTYHNKIIKKGQIPWNKGKKGLQTAWNKGLNRKDPRVDKYIRAHEGKKISKETKIKIKNSWIRRRLKCHLSC